MARETNFNDALDYIYIANSMNDKAYLIAGPRPYNDDDNEDERELDDELAGDDNNNNHYYNDGGDSDFINAVAAIDTIDGSSAGNIKNSNYNNNSNSSPSSPLATAALAAVAASASVAAAAARITAKAAHRTLATGAIKLIDVDGSRVAASDSASSVLDNNYTNVAVGLGAMLLNDTLLLEGNDTALSIFGEWVNVNSSGQLMNTSTAINVTASKVAEDDFTQLLRMAVTSVLLGLMILITIIGNVFVIAAIILERNLQNVANYLVASLAVADLFVACLVMPLGAVYEISQGWILGPELCDIWTSCDVLCCTASILHLVAIAVDRHVNEIQKLIRLYRANECLWNPKTSGFYNMALNKNAWLRISCFFNNRFTVDQLKLQILSLRYYFAQEQVALKQSQLGGYHYEPRHSYFEELQFLKAPMSNSANLKAIETDNKINYLAVDIFPPNSSENSIHSEKVDFQLPSALIQTVDILEINRESELPQPPLELKAQPNELRAASGNDSYHATADNQTRSPYSARHRRSSSHSRNSDNERCKYNQQQLQYMNTVSTGQRVSSHPLKKVLTGRYRCQPRRSNAEDWHSNNDVSSRKVPNRMSDVRQNDAYEYNPYLGNFREIVRKKSGNDAKKPLENYNSTEPHYLLRKEAVHQDGQRANQNPLSPIQFEKQLPRNIDSSYYPEDQDNPPTIKQEPHNLSNGRQTPPTVNRQRGSLEKKSRTDLKEAAAVVSENAFTQTPDDDPSLGTNEINSPDDRSRLNKASENSPLVRSRAQKMQQMSNELLERLQIKRRRNEDNFRERPEKKLISEEDNPDGRLRPVDEEPQERYLGKSDVQPDPFLSYQNESKEFSANQPLSAQSNSINAPSSSYQGRYSYDRDYYHDKDQAEYENIQQGQQPLQNDNGYASSNRIQAQRSNDGYTSAYNDKYRFNRQDPKMIERCRCEDKYIDQEKRGQKDWQNYPNYVERRRKYADGRGTIRERYAEQDPSYGRGIREEIIRDYSQRTCSPQSSKVNLRAIGKYNERRETLYNLGGEHRIHGCQANEQENYTRRTQYYNLDSRDTVVTKNQIDQEHYKRNEMEKMSKIHCQKYLEKTAYVKANEGKHYNVEEKMQDCTCSTDEEELETVKVKKSISRCDVAVETDIDMSLTDRQKKPMCDCSDESFSVSMNNGKKTNSNEKPKAANYWAVTNIDYIHSRTSNRVFMMIFCVWTAAVIVSLAPQFGWKDPDYLQRIEQQKCMVSQDVSYQVFATCCTFYVPLLVILALYWKIYQTARKRIHRRRPRPVDMTANNNQPDATAPTDTKLNRLRLRLGRFSTAKNKSGGAGGGAASSTALGLVEGNSTNTVNTVEDTEFSSSNVDSKSRAGIEVPSTSGSQIATVSHLVALANQQHASSAKQQRPVATVQQPRTETLSKEEQPLEEEQHHQQQLDEALETATTTSEEATAAATTAALGKANGNGGVGGAVEVLEDPQLQQQLEQMQELQKTAKCGGVGGGGASTSNATTITSISALSPQTPTSPAIVPQAGAVGPMTAKTSTLTSCNQAHPLCSSANASGAVTPEPRTKHHQQQPTASHQPQQQLQQQQLSSIANPMQKVNKRKETLEAKRERKAAKTLAIITGAFVVCWLPFFVMALTMPLCAACQISDSVASLFLWLGYFNSTLNPVIYTIFSPEFRQAFKRILFGGHRPVHYRSGKL
ncbi:GH22141 [Drosophila grimshawi]|uniref:GH22141 n=3 Tax=Drosophila TaxID=7215 RepID=B4J4L6_DROGR|nr:GH22141 [Drosophila grimshawi]